MTNFINYDITVTPSPLAIDLKVTVANTDITATIDHVPSVAFHLTPHGNLLEKISSTVAWPIANLIAPLAKDKPKEILEGKSFSIGTVPNYDTNGIRITPRHVVLGSANIGTTPMLKVTATLAVTKPTTSSIA